MTKKFIEKVKWYGIVDTRRYRYVYDVDGRYIRRLPIEWLDTTRAIDSWTIIPLAKKKLYRIKENWDEWGGLTEDDAIIEHETIKRLSEEWEVPMEELLEKCEEL